jgi:hypothetical protein
MAWFAIFVLAGLGVYRRMQLAYLVVLFLALAGGVLNGAGHLLLSATQGRYFLGDAPPQSAPCNQPDLRHRKYPRFSVARSIAITN